MKDNSTFGALDTQADRKQYISTDLSPYVTHVQRIESSPGSDSFLNPFTFGFF